MKTRKQYSKEFKLDAIRLVTEHGYSRAEVVRNLGINANMLGRWVLEHQAHATGGRSFFVPFRDPRGFGIKENCGGTAHDCEG